MKKPAILFYDIESAPNLGYIWGRYEQTVIAYKQERSLLSVAWKWLGDKQVSFATVEGDKDDKDLCLLIKGLYNESDIVVAHNGDEFDQKVVRARMLYHNIAPHKILTTIDTKKVAKAYFSFNGNDLKGLAKFLNLPHKLETTGFELWLKCMRGDAKAWREMVRYNKRDVIVLEKLYKRFLPWINNHPNIARILNPHDVYGKKCPTCASSRVGMKGKRANARTIQQQWKCKDCGRYFLTTIKAISGK